MAVKITKKLTDQNGQPVAAGTHIEYNIKIGVGFKDMTVNLVPFLSKEAFEKGFKHYIPNELKAQNELKFVLKEGDAVNLSVNHIDTLVKTAMQNKFPDLAGNIEIVE